MNLKTNSRIEKTKNTLIQELDQEAVLLNLENNQYYHLNKDSIRIFNVLITSESVEKAFSTLLINFDVPPDELWRDLDEFVADLVKSGLVQVVDE